MHDGIDVTLDIYCYATLITHAIPPDLPTITIRPEE